MQGQAISGLQLRFSRGEDVRNEYHAKGVWQRWRSFHHDIMRHVHACDRLEVELTVEKLADDLDEALGLVERRVDELCNLQLLRCGSDRRVELEIGSPRMCG